MFIHFYSLRQGHKSHTWNVNCVRNEVESLYQYRINHAVPQSTRRKRIYAHDVVLRFPRLCEYLRTLYYDSRPDPYTIFNHNDELMLYLLFDFIMEILDDDLDDNQDTSRDSVSPSHVGVSRRNI